MIDGSLNCLKNLSLYPVELLAVTKTIGTKDSNLNIPVAVAVDTTINSKLPDVS